MKGITNPHSREDSSRSSMGGNRESLKALMSEYLASPSLIGCGSKVPIQPLKRWPAKGRLERVYQVTKSALYISLSILGLDLINI